MSEPTTDPTRFTAAAHEIAGVETLARIAAAAEVSPPPWALVAKLVLCLAFPSSFDVIAKRRGLIPDYESEEAETQLYAFIEGKDEATLRGFTLELLAAGGEGIEGDALDVACQHYEIDRDALVREAEAKIRQGDAAARAVAARGTCRVCGCTEEKACAGGCSWVDEEETFCSDCNGMGDHVLDLLAEEPSKSRTQGWLFERVFEDADLEPEDEDEVRLNKVLDDLIRREKVRSVGSGRHPRFEIVLAAERKAAT